MQENCKKPGNKLCKESKELGKKLRKKCTKEQATKNEKNKQGTRLNYMYKSVNILSKERCQKSNKEPFEKVCNTCSLEECEKYRDSSMEPGKIFVGNVARNKARKVCYKVATNQAMMCAKKSKEIFKNIWKMEQRNRKKVCKKCKNLVY